jgi:predicted nucleic acid binding AN1-type Zn finger protein
LTFSKCSTNRPDLGVPDSCIDCGGYGSSWHNCRCDV